MTGTLSRWFAALPVRGKLNLALSVQLVMLALGCAATLLVMRELAAARTAIGKSQAIINQVGALNGEILNELSAVRGFIISGKTEFLDPYLVGAIEVGRLVQELRVQIVEEPAQAARLGQLEQLLNDWHTRIAQPNIEFARDPATRHLAQERVAGGEGKRRVDAILQLCLQMIADERTRLERSQAAQFQSEKMLIGIALLLLVIGSVAGLRSVGMLDRLLGEPLSGLASLLPRLDSGEVVNVPYRERRDEVGVLARAIHQLRDTRVQQEGVEWVRERSVQMIAALQLCESEALFGEVLLRRLSESLDAGYALAYRWNERLGELEWCAAYGLPDPDVVRRRFRLGEGLVGQCMVERRSIELTPVPDGYLRVVSGLGAALPRVLLFVPVTARGEAVAVLELGLLHDVQPRHRDLIEQALVTTGLAWQALARSLRTRELLAESEAQADRLRVSREELRAQQEELRATNEILQARTEQLEQQGRRLRASEEELRAQAEEMTVTNAMLEEKSESLTLRQTELETARGELELRAADLERASRYKSEFLANMSHELRTPLNSMLILSKMLADNAEGNLDAEQMESARIVHDSGRSLLGLINDILDLSKVEAGKMTLDFEDVSLAGCLSALMKRFEPLATERGLAFDLTLAPDAPQTLHTDGNRLSQVISNLLSNAFKFTHEGGIELRAESIPEGVAISVRDSGIGIAPEQLERVFHAFEQADSGTSRRYGGTGLGLSIVSQLTALMGGEVLVESRQGEGSTFTLRLPERPGQRLATARVAFVKPEPEPVEADVAPALPVGPPGEDSATNAAPALLVVEDDPVFARLLADIAARRGMDTVIAGSGREALEIARQRRLLGVLLDIGLPDISGWDVLEQIKANPRTSSVPVHVISGVPEAERCVELGAVGFLQKPVTREAVVQALERVRSGARLGEPRRLLLVDDDGASRAAVRALLKHENAEIVEAGDAEEALSLLEAQRFDGVILDLGLPGISGFDFLDQASGRAEMPPVVIYSGRDLTPEENLRLRGYTESIVIKGARSPERLLDEVALFLHAVHRPAATAAAHDPTADIVGKTVMVVDDDMRNVFALSKALRARGLSVVMGQDGLKALAHLETRKDIDLVLMDVMMPGMDGLETIRRIRAQRQWRSLPIIAVTAKAMKGDREKCLEAGANDYCQKPIDIDQLMSQIRVWI